MAPANRLVYYLAIPAMIFRAISTGQFKTQFHAGVLSILIVSILVVFAIAWGAGVAFRVNRRQLGTYIQSAFHGNLGYIGLAVAYYALGTQGFARAGILAGFIMILQNFLAVIVLQIYAGRDSASRGYGAVVTKVMGNPVVVSALAGIFFSVLELPVPVVVDRSLAIVGGMALPMALLIIGASLSLDLLRQGFSGVLPSALMKLLLLPGIGYFLFSLFGVPVEQFLPGLILLASPSATMVYVMAKEMKGDPDMAVAAISSTTLLSAVTLAVWLNVA